MANLYTCKKCGYETHHPDLICPVCGDSYPDMDVRDDGPECRAVLDLITGVPEVPEGWSRGVALCVKDHVQKPFQFRRGDYFSAEMRKFADTDGPVPAIFAETPFYSWGVRGKANWVFLNNTQPTGFRRAGFVSEEIRDMTHNARRREERPQEEARHCPNCGAELRTFACDVCGYA